MFIGFPQSGSTLVHDFLTSGSTPAPAAPDALPTFSVYDDTGALDGQIGTCTATDATTGLYRFSISLASPYVSGTTYSVLVTWAISSVTYSDLFKFVCT